MNRFVVLFVSVITLCSLAFAQSSSPVFSTRMSGEFADATFPTGHFMNISVSQGTNTSGQEQTVLIYSYGFSNPDGSSTIWIGGGTIPNDSFMTGSDAVAHLNVDTTQVSGFFTLSCTTGSSCTRGPVGVIQIDWNRNGFSSSRSSQDTWRTLEGARFHTQANTALNSATAGGSFFGIAINTEAGNIGTDSNSLFEVFPN